MAAIVSISSQIASDIHNYFVNEYIELLARIYQLEDDRRDDPGDWDRDTQEINECLEKAKEVLDFADVFGDVDIQACRKKAMNMVY